MPGCILRVGGKSFDPDAFLVRARLKACRTWHAGEPLNHRTPSSNRVFRNSGFQCDVSRNDGKFRQQAEDAEAFLARFRDDLLAVAEDPRVEFCDLDFAYYCRLGERKSPSNPSVVAVQGDYLPSSFLRLAGELRVGVALSLYPSPEQSVAMLES